MTNNIFDIFMSFGSGCLMLIFRNWFAKEIIEAQKSLGFKPREKDMVICKILIVAVGISFIFFGFMQLGVF
jgi:TctA family transporter